MYNVQCTMYNVCVYVYVYVYVHVYVYVYVYVYIYIVVYIYVCSCVYIYMYRCIYMCVYIYMCIYMYIYMCIYIYLYVYIYIIYTYLCVRVSYEPILHFLGQCELRPKMLCHSHLAKESQKAVFKQSTLSVPKNEGCCSIFVVSPRCLLLHLLDATSIFQHPSSENTRMVATGRFDFLSSFGQLNLTDMETGNRTEAARYGSTGLDKPSNNHNVTCPTCPTCCRASVSVIDTSASSARDFGGVHSLLKNGSRMWSQATGT